MTLQEAILTGKPFKRSHHSHFITVGADEILYWENTDKKVSFTSEAILAEDWIVQLTSDYVQDCFDTVFPEDYIYDGRKKDFYMELGI